MSRRRIVLLMACALALPGSPAQAEETRARAASDTGYAPGQVAGWDALVDGLRDLPTRMLARLPEPMRNDPQIQQEVGRLALQALASSAIYAIGSDGDNPVFLPQIGQVLNVGQPNADTSYRTARITPGGTYRIRGQRGSLRMVNVGQLGPGPGEQGAGAAHPGPTRVYHDINALHVDDQGRFDVILSPQRPAGYTGDWWELQPTTAKLLLRMVSSAWDKEEDPAISIERLDRPVGRSRTPAAELERRLRTLPVATAFMATMFVDHVEQLRREGYVNRLKMFDVSQIGGLAGQFYYEGAYDLADDEALIIEARVPGRCVYRSMILTNELYETTDWTNNQSSLNDAQARPDGDGILRVVVSARDPGVPNWLDTAGYARGAVQGRWTHCDAQPIPSVRKLALADVRKALPDDTPVVSAEERQRLIRERRHAYQQRPLW
ncbi:MAG: hypothetical protein H6R45_733 [Proteobacteria bacterium]|nr:hypothetical protein [Pseudomonadota bacterium]